ncbi:MAG: 23S rRNA (uracil-5-)-methyltransferase RumA, partial [Erysipelotrichaceae bacterium]|nr:23S rRNA (uracil-5-)-methyltransferase RumA [Erysipelotrichaceae bacterium]
MKKNDRFIGTCYEYTNEGLGIVKYEGQVFFVTNILRGETAEIVCTLLKKNYGFGKAIKLLEVSEHRCEPLCSCYKLCGGCHLQLMD